MSKKKSSEKEKVRCIECSKAALLQWDNNPVVAHCIHGTYPKVANTLRTCCEFRRNLKTPDIRKLTHYK